MYPLTNPTNLKPLVEIHSPSSATHIHAVMLGDRDLLSHPAAQPQSRPQVGVGLSVPSGFRRSEKGRVVLAVPGPVSQLLFLLEKGALPSGLSPSWGATPGAAQGEGEKGTSTCPSSGNALRYGVGKGGGV